MIGWILLGLFLLLIALILAAPLVLRINTAEDEYRVSWWWFGSGQLRLEGSPRLEWTLLGFHRSIPLAFPAAAAKKPTAGETEKPRKASRRKMTVTRILRKARRILASFRIKRLRADIDTDDFITNAYLYPALFLVDRGRGNIRVNFVGKNELDLEVQNRVSRILWALIG